MNRRALLVSGAAETFLREMTRKNSASHPLGLLSIAAVLKMHGWDVHVLDLLLGVPRRVLIDEVSSWQPSFLGLGACTAEFYGALAVAREARRVNPGLKVVMGGPHVSFEPEEALRSGFVDYVVTREGEATILELLLAMEGSLPLSRVRGLVYLDDDRLVHTGPRPFLDHLDQLPLSPFSLVPAEGYLANTTIVSSRGCPGGCIFCSSGALSGRHYRMRSAESVFSEVYHRYRKTGEEYFVLFEDTFTGSAPRVHRFCDLLIHSGLKLKWRCNSRVTRADPELLQHLARAGCVAVHYGIESGDQSILRSIQKGITLEQIERTVASTAAVGMVAMCSFMIGHPEDTEQSVLKTLELAGRLKREYGAVVAVACLVPYPGTAVSLEAEKMGINVEASSWSAYDINNVIISTRHLTSDRLRELAFDAVPRLIGGGTATP